MYEESDEDVEGEDEEAASRREARRRLKKETEVCHTTGFLGLTSTLVSCRCVDCAGARGPKGPEALSVNVDVPHRPLAPFQSDCMHMFMIVTLKTIAHFSKC